MRNYISHIQEDDGTWIQHQQEILLYAENNFKNLYFESALVEREAKQHCVLSEMKLFLQHLDLKFLASRYDYLDTQFTVKKVERAIF